MIELSRRMAVIGTVNEILLNMMENGEPIQAICLTPKIVSSYVFMLEVRSGYLISEEHLNTQSIESFFRNQCEVFQKTLNLDGSAAYQLRIDKFLTPPELTQARSTPLSHCCVVSIIAQMLDALGETGGYPQGFLRSMKIEDAMRQRRTCPRLTG